MEDNKNPNYDQEDRDYKDAPMTTDFEKSKLNNDPNQAYQKNAEQFEEFSNDQPNRPANNGTVENSGNIQDDTWNNEGNSDRNIGENSNDPYPISEAKYDNNGNRQSEKDRESDIKDEDLNQESDFDESDIDDVEEDDDELDDEEEMDREHSDLRL